MGLRHGSLSPQQPAAPESPLRLPGASPWRHGAWAFLVSGHLDAAVMEQQRQRGINMTKGLQSLLASSAGGYARLIRYLAPFGAASSDAAPVGGVWRDWHVDIAA